MKAPRILPLGSPPPLGGLSARSKLSPLLIDKACGSPTTGRNWNSVLKISEMIEQRARKKT